ncbi:hypothetical protein A3L09_10735 (plasmid) [Thermococcus profundus]|uniref:Uncharacterized protein n=1 Tax=Thermococcus profundus TaxID=49899 RepID=A0A2Z2MD85_THEPR|nr:hypothetical protein [Thermococcus profundus]ASJ03826.1 hypothetical protein A3L09_10735 [Thermococcus profundus]
MVTVKTFDHKIRTLDNFVKIKKEAVYLPKIELIYPNASKEILFCPETIKTFSKEGPAKALLQLPLTETNTYDTPTEIRIYRTHSPYEELFAVATAGLLIKNCNQCPQVKGLNFLTEKQARTVLSMINAGAWTKEFAKQYFAHLIENKRFYFVDDSTGTFIVPNKIKKKPAIAEWSRLNYDWITPKVLPGYSPKKNKPIIERLIVEKPFPKVTIYKIYVETEEKSINIYGKVSIKAKDVKPFPKGDELILNYEVDEVVTSFSSVTKDATGVSIIDLAHLKGYLARENMGKVEYFEGNLKWKHAELFSLNGEMYVTLYVEWKETGSQDKIIIPRRLVGILSQVNPEFKNLPVVMV